MIIITNISRDTYQHKMDIKAAFSIYSKVNEDIICRKSLKGITPPKKREKGIEE